MSEIVLDSSAVLALLCEETGAQVVFEHLPGAIISTVNVAEIFSKAVEKGLGLEPARLALAKLRLSVIPFDDDLAFITGTLREPTRILGLSLGDRACLALGMARQLPVLTTESRWKDVTLDIEIIQIR